MILLRGTNIQAFNLMENIMRKTFLAAFVLLLSTSAMAQIPQGSICVYPKQLLVLEGSDVWLKLRQDDNSLLNLWSNQNSHFGAGFLQGIVSSASASNRQIILNPFVLKNVSHDAGLTEDYAQKGLTQALKIDVDRACESTDQK